MVPRGSGDMCSSTRALSVYEAHPPSSPCVSAAPRPAPPSECPRLPKNRPLTTLRPFRPGRSSISGIAPCRRRLVLWRWRVRSGKPHRRRAAAPRAPARRARGGCRRALASRSPPRAIPPSERRRASASAASAMRAGDLRNCESFCCGCFGDLVVLGHRLVECPGYGSP